MDRRDRSDERGPGGGRGFRAGGPPMKGTRLLLKPNHQHKL